MEMKKIIIHLYNDSIVKNAIYLITTNFTTFILGFLFWIVASRYYSPNDIGITSAILSSMSLISMISSIGFPTSLLYYLPKESNNANRIINSCLFVSIIISGVFSIIFISGIRIWEPQLVTTFDKGLIIIFIIATVLTTISGLMSGAFTAGKRSSFHMIKENMFSIAKIFPLILLAELGAMGIFLSWGIGLLISMIIGLILLYKTWEYHPKFAIDHPIIKNMAGYSAGNYVAGIFFNLPRMVLPIMIVGFISAESAGYFFITITIASLLYGIPQSIGNSLLAESTNGDFRKNVIKAIRFNLAILIPGLLLFIIFGKWTLNLFNHNYANAATTLIILAMASIPISLIGIFNTVRNAQERVESTIKINAIMTIITLVLSIPLMKIFNIDGAALAYLIANTIVALIIIIKINDSKELSMKLLVN